MGKNKPYKNPFAGKRVPTSNVKASKLPGKKQAAAAAGDGDPHSGGKPEKRRKERSFLGLLAAGAGFAALWAWNVWSRAQQGREDRRILGAMLARPLAVTEHAACRMDCRYIGHGEVVEALRSGRINSRKSQPALRPCPKYTVDAVVGPRGQRKNVQGVFAACPHETRVITVIDADTDWPCGPC